MDPVERTLALLRAELSRTPVTIVASGRDRFLDLQACIPRETLLVQTLLVQVCPLAQVPQLSVPPQPAAALPHLKPIPVAGRRPCTSSRTAW